MFVPFICLHLLLRQSGSFDSQFGSRGFVEPFRFSPLGDSEVPVSSCPGPSSFRMAPSSRPSQTPVAASRGTGASASSAQRRRPRNRSRNSRGGGALFTGSDTFWHPFSPPANPPPAQDIRPRRLVIQEPLNVTAGARTDVTCQFLFSDRFGTSGYSCLALHKIIIWNSTPSDHSDLYLTPAAPGSFPNTIVKYESNGSSTKRATVGYRVSGPMVGPFAKANNLVHVQSSQSNILIQVEATFY